MTVVSSAFTATVRATRRSPLADRASELAQAGRHGPGGVRLAEEAFLTQVSLWVHPDSPAVDRIERVLGVSLPKQPNTVHGDLDGAILWLGPDEWLVLAPDGAAPAIVQELTTALTGVLGSVVDLSANRTTLRLAGPQARDVLEKGCSVDLHPRAFSTGRCAQTLLARAEVVLWQVTAEPGYRILVRPSFADYVADWLIDAMAEYAGSA